MSEAVYCQKCDTEYPFSIVVCPKCHIQVEVKNKEPYRVGIVGSRDFADTRRVRDFIHILHEEYGDRLEIVSGGQRKGADGFAKRWALYLLESDQYKEFPPAHYEWNMYCVKPRYEKGGKQNYGLPYRVYHYNMRNTEIAEYSDVIYAFIPTDRVLEASTGTTDTCQKALKLGKPVFVMGSSEGDREVTEIRNALKPKKKKK